MNSKKIEQVKKVEVLDHQLGITLNKIDQINKPAKINKKQLSIMVSIPFGIAVLLTAIISFLVIDPFRWYTIGYDTYLTKRKAKIVEKFQSFTMPNEFVLQDKSKKVENLLHEIKNKSDLAAVFASINERINYETTHISIYDGGKLLKEKDNLTSKIYQMKFNFIDQDIDIGVTISINVRISPF